MKCVSEQKKSQMGKLHKNFSKSFWQHDKRDTISAANTNFFLLLLNQRAMQIFKLTNKENSFHSEELFLLIFTVM